MGTRKRGSKEFRGPSFEGVRAKKGLGQHFLADQDIAIEIVDSLLIPETDLNGAPTAEYGVDVLEIGPGTGVLTQYLLMDKRINLQLAEIDAESIDKLRAKFPQFLYTLQPRDFLHTELLDVFPKNNGEVFIIGNFPYNISSQIFFKILEDKDRVAQVVCMLQKEVAQRLASPPGGKDYGILSVLLQAWYDIEYLFTVDEKVFLPPPKVKSGVIRLWRNQRTDLGCDPQLFKQVVKTCFGQRRKTIRNSIKPLVSQLLQKSPSPQPDTSTCQQAQRPQLSHEQIQQRLEQTGLLDSRPEKLSVEEFVLLTQALY